MKNSHSHENGHLTDRASNSSTSQPGKHATETASENAGISDLNIIDVPRPCTMDWGLMTGDERVRFCSHCTKNVYNISEMTAAGALQLINETEGRLCIRMRRRSDGTVVTSDCPPIKERFETTGRRNFLQFSMASLLALLTVSAGLCAAAPWIGEKVQPLVDRFFPTVADDYAADDYVEGEIYLGRYVPQYIEVD